MAHYTHPVLDKLSQKLMAYSMASWCTESLEQSERELEAMNPPDALTRMDRNFWLGQIRKELAKRDG